MTTLAEMHGALVLTLREGSGWTTGPTLASVTPCLVVPVPEVVYWASFGSDGLWGQPGEPGIVFGVLAAVGVADALDTVERLLWAMDPTSEGSVPYVVADNPTLGGVVDGSIVEGVRRVGLQSAEGREYDGVEFAVRLIARRG